MKEINEIVETRTARAWLDEDGILHMVFFLYSEVTLDDIKELDEVTLKIAKGKKIPFLTDIRDSKFSTREAREYGSKKGFTVQRAVTALLVGSSTSRMFGNLYLNFNQPTYPIKLFTSEEEAIEWLKGFIEQNS